MMSNTNKERDYKPYEHLTFDDFRRLAKDDKLTRYEKIGFPNEYRKGYEKYIFEDIRLKLKSLGEKNKIILDIGCGCSELAFMIIDNCERNNSELLLVDSQEMLSLLPSKPFVSKFACRFSDCPTLFEKYTGRVDGILVYSVIHHVFLEANIFDFIDKACELLKDGGEMLIGDIPNVSKRKRFFSSKSGVEYHKKFMGTEDVPQVDLAAIEEKKIDDGVIFGILQRYRNFGFDTYLLPQDKGLPMANRREDVLVRKP
mgnify:CR=1 FL=1